MTWRQPSASPRPFDAPGPAGQRATGEGGAGDYADRRVRVFALSGSTYAEVLVSEVLGIGSEEIGSRIRWP